MISGATNHFSLSMAFADRSMEERFLSQHRDETAEHLRWVCLLGAAFMIGFLWQDTLMSASGYKAINIRIFGALPVSALVWYLSRNLGVRRFISYISAFFWLSYACFTIAIFIIYEPGPYGLTSSAGLGSFLLILFGIFTFSNLRFWASLMVGLVTLLTYTVSVAFWTKADIADFIMGDFLTVVALMIGLAAKTLFTDRARRRLFETSELLRESYTIVEKQVRERTAELQITNAQLTAEITERNRAEEAMRESEVRYRRLLEEAPVGIAVHSGGKIVFTNPAGVRLLGGISKEQIVGRSIFQIIHPDNLKEAQSRIQRMLAGEEGLYPVDDVYLKLDGTPVNVEVMATALPYKGNPAVQVIVTDITERKKAEEEKAKLENQLFQSQKMEAIGTLAGGIAHDFNNILAAIIGYTELAMDGNQKEIQSKHLQETLKGAERAKNLVKQILTFSRQDEHEKKPLDIKFLLKEAVKFLRASIPTTVEIHQHLTDESCNILADPTQMHQIIMNLCTNAAHAMKQTGGILKIELASRELAQGDLAQNHDLKPGHYVQLTVSDTGHGIDPAHIQRIFDPFFTTKSKDEGTGLGLSVVYGIVKSHDGVITVYSEPEKGTSFSVYLPRIIHAETRKAGTGKAVTGGKERILFVDDEPTLVDLGTRMLSPLGYEVTGVTSSADALDMFRAEPQRFDLVITDMTLPKMTGIDLSREILKIRPDIPIIICSGIREPSTEEQVNSLGIKAYLTKPLTRNELSRVVRETLDGHEKPIS